MVKQVSGKFTNHVLLRAMRNPEMVSGFTADEWSRLLLLGRISTLLPRLGGHLRNAGLMERLPPKAQDHFIAADMGAVQGHMRLTWEINRIRRAFFRNDQRIILLKGGAYAHACLPCSRGRVSSDIDILVPRDDILAVEETLKANGWRALQQDAYDEHYYRQWMHELPPLRHEGRGMVIDVHHTIVPLTSRLKPDAAKLIAAARPVDDMFSTLAPADMVLHSSIHLFHDGDLSGGLRDLYDIHELLTDFGADAAFWPDLVARAGELGVGRPIFYACRYAKILLGTAVPPGAEAGLRAFAPSALTLALMDWLAVEALVPDSIFHPRKVRGMACFIMYLRSHWLRMPPLMLARHLTAKAIRRWKHPIKSAPVPEANLQIDQ